MGVQWKGNERKGLALNNKSISVLNKLSYSFSHIHHTLERWITRIPAVCAILLRNHFMNIHGTQICTNAQKNGCTIHFRYVCLKIVYLQNKIKISISFNYWFVFEKKKNVLINLQLMFNRKLITIFFCRFF